MQKIKTVKSVPEHVILVAADIVGLYPNIPHQAGLKALREALEKRALKKIPTSDLVKRQDLCWIIIYLSLAVSPINKNQVQLYELNLNPLMPASTWIRLNKSF